MKKGKLIIGILTAVSAFNLCLYHCDNNNIAEAYPMSNTQVIHNDLIEDILQSIKDNTELRESDFEIIHTSSEMADINVQTSVNKKTKKINIYPDDEYIINYKEDMKLSDIELPNGWKWEDKDISIDIGEYTYKSIYTTDDDYIYIGQTEKKVKVIIEKSIYKVSGITITITEGTSLTNDLLPTLEKGILEWVIPNETVDKNCTKTCRFTPYDTTHYNSIDNINVIINITPETSETDKKNTTDKKSDGNNTTGGNNSGNNTNEKNSNNNLENNTGGNSDKNTTDKKNESESDKTPENDKNPQNIQVGTDNNSDNISDNGLGVNTSVRLDNEYQLPTISLGLGEDIDIDNSNLSNNEVVDIQVTVPNDEENTKENTEEDIKNTNEEGGSTENTTEEDDENSTTEKDNEEKNKISEDKKNGGEIDIFGIAAIIGVAGIGGYAFISKMKSRGTSKR